MKITKAIKTMNDFQDNCLKKEEEKEREHCFIQDNRIQKQKIIINLQRQGYDFDLNAFIDEILADIETIITQRKLNNDVKIKIILE